MKNIVMVLVVAVVMVWAVAYSLTKTIDNRCSYYMSQAHPTQYEIEMCKK